MPNSTLFQFEREQMHPATDRSEPTLWLKRLVILSTLNSDSIIRDIKFRRGLNIIQTHHMQVQGGPVAGHSVGKTLMMRLIRYTLGENQFGSEETQNNIAAVLKTAWVVGHWSIAGADWIVVRPMNEAAAKESFAADSDDWKQVVDSQLKEHSHRHFVQMVSDAVLSNLPKFNLPRGREAKWLDVLAWLSRDYQCGYRKANEWRHEDANSGPSLNLEDNSLIMQWVMGLMNTDEIEQRVNHHELLNNCKGQKQTHDREQKRMDTLWPALRDKLELKADIEVTGIQKTMNSVDPVDIVKEKIASLERLRTERLAESRIKEFESEQHTVQDQIADTEATVRTCKNMVQYIEKQIEEIERDPLHPYRLCKAEPECWMKKQAETMAHDPGAAEHVADLRNQIDEQQKTCTFSHNEKKTLQKSLEVVNKQLKEERSRLAIEISGIDEKIGFLKGLEDDSTKIQALAISVERSTKDALKAEREIEGSLKKQEAIRQKHRNEVRQLSDVYQGILQEIFGVEDESTVRIDGNGLHPVPNRKLAPGGAALSVMTSVLSFDIACLAGSIYGIGQHPRFLMHDSPREGDMEGPLFQRLFEIVHELEAKFTNPDHISFQYIVTTTSAPPQALADENGPYVRLTLDARSEEGKLLGITF
ncbi:hypothetical protein V6x_16170 [Gimesia chilikensis]|uniref:Uncharacterized protein n=1 Tax=Gimesia chilikensis TaxID=2605989 RepID=A0A517W9K6_9PLAN|nr:hypothetical protein [Gimesia chilikensis]QDU01934.1 hypothetical protein V6x_16170 [Gimesia chilikensis]